MPSDENSSPEAAVAAETFADHCVAVNATRFWVLIRIVLGAAPIVVPLEYFIVARRPEVATSLLSWWFGITAVVLLAALAFRASAAVRRHADVTVAAVLASCMAIVAVGESHIGGFETLYAGITAITPIIGAIFLMPTWRRTWVASVGPLVYFATFLGMRPEAIEYRYAFVPVFHSLLGLGLSVTFGEIAYRLAREHHAKRVRLAGEAARLDAAVRARTTVVLELARNLVSLEETNRTRIARELHDELGQELTAARLEANGVAADVERRLGRDDEVTRRAAGIEARIALAQQMMRDVIFSLRPPALDDYDLATALRLLVDRCRHASGLTIDYQNALDGNRLTDTQATTVFRVLQEALTNIGRHAGASRVDVRIAVADGDVVLVVDDDGRGFEATGSRIGFGLRGMRERLRLVAGELSLGANDGRGTVLRAAFPLGGERPVVEPVENSRHDL